MSYGVWKYKGNGWSLINMDHGSWDCGYWDDLQKEQPKVYYMLGAQALKQGWMRENEYSGVRKFSLKDTTLPDDPAFIGWAIYQLKVGRHIYCAGDHGDHGAYFACLPQDYAATLADPKFIKHNGVHAPEDYSSVDCPMLQKTEPNRWDW